MKIKDKNTDSEECWNLILLTLRHLIHRHGSRVRDRKVVALENSQIKLSGMLENSLGGARNKN